ncbi:10260_t:CDS:2 [Funneliformis mosseae]|uniref:10260_t:CDS:1 n=1 Tax=Funneliformis mosseae TaxID=27381 RepID=A0A9N8WID1_FUNMO|nr:10260_t:CDS:2 [Funneliformis mosseae]
MKNFYKQVENDDNNVDGVKISLIILRKELNYFQIGKDRIISSSKEFSKD